MSVNYKVIQAKDFIKAKPSGETDIEESKSVLGELAELAKIIPDSQILLDIRDAYGNLQLEELKELILEFSEHRNAFKNKIAVLTRSDEQFDKAVFVEMCTNIDGFKVAAFSEFEEATDWLQSDDTAASMVIRRS